MHNRLWIAGLAVVMTALALSACATAEALPVEPEAGNAGAICTDTTTAAQMSYEQAINAANKSACVEQGQLKETHFCNADTGT